MRWCAYEPHLVHPRGPWRGTVAQEWRLVGSFAGMREKRTTLPAIVDAGTRLSMLGEETPEDGMHPDGHALLKTQLRRDLAEVGARELPLLTEAPPGRARTTAPGPRAGELAQEREAR